MPSLRDFLAKHLGVPTGKLSQAEEAALEKARTNPDLTTASGDRVAFYDGGEVWIDSDGGIYPFPTKT